MAFDQTTRGRLQKLVNACRSLLADEFSVQLQQTYGLDPKTGDVTPMARLTHLDDRQRHTAEVLRQTMAHYMGTESDTQDHRLAVMDRMVREQAFTVLNRIAALLMIESRGQLFESVSKGHQSRGYQLYAKIAGAALGETGQAYQVYLFSVFDELAQELPALFDRYASNGLLFPRETTLRSLLEELNHFEIEQLWAEDETIGWIYQYFNSKEERKAMRDASQAPRNSRELAVRNQFFTPRYVVEFLVDNTLGRIWFNATGGLTTLRDSCKYLLVKPDEAMVAVQRLRDPRTIKLLDPACGSMHFGLYAFDLFLKIYEEAWDWEQAHGAGSLDSSVQEGDELKPLSQIFSDRSSFLREVPKFIIERNIYGVDIDPRAAQIATLALWLRAQREWNDSGLKGKDRPNIIRGNVVAAVAPPTERDLALKFRSKLTALDAELFGRTLHLLEGLPELGVLLRVERDLPVLIREIYGHIGDMFKEKRAKSWGQIEGGLREALTEFSTTSKSSYQGRLFAQDALQGLRLIDICREKFDVVVMNPPFGALSLGVKDYLTHSYPDSKNDLLGIFVDRGIDLLRSGGRLGAITSRTCFFLTSFADWRKNVVLGRSSLEAVADLGQGVMDDAMVEAAAYVLERGKVGSTSQVIRAIAEEDREGALNASVASIRNGSHDSRLFTGERSTYDLLPESPFVYWVGASIVKPLINRKKFTAVGDANVGLSTADNPRFVRLVWEIEPKNHFFCYYPVDQDFCSYDDPVVKSYLARRHIGARKWSFFVMAGASQPWFSPLMSMLNWEGKGYEMRNFLDTSGKRRATIRNPDFFSRPGFSWTRRAVRFYPYVIPSNCIHSASRYMAFPERGKEVEAIGVCASRIASSYLRFYGEKFEFPNFLVENVKQLPWPEFNEELHTYLSDLISKQVQARRQAYQNFEPYHEFLLPAKVRDFTDGGKALAFDPVSLLGEEGERLVAAAYGLNPEQASEVERDLKEALAFQSSAPTSEEESDADEDADFALDTSERSNEYALVSYLVGCAFGRWDIRFATGEKKPPDLASPFAPIAVCPPGMLQSNLGLPANHTDVDNSYPIAVCWNGVLVSDEGHAQDIVRAARSALKVIWPNEADAVEANMCAKLGVNSLSNYFASPGGFFSDHLKKYTKSTRKAPIYWSLATPSGSYTLWIYYPRLSHETLYTAINDMVEPKLRLVGSELTTLRNKATGKTRDEEKKYESLQAFEGELIEFRDALMKIALNYYPSQNDGVQISASPLWPVVNFNPWKKVLKDTWIKLEKGSFDWASLAMAYWPERVRKGCETDKSLAIAHGLEELYVERDVKPKRAKKIKV